eukprot:scaffold13911_cov186-Alexandrium_tamarense.AAC.1
MDERKGTQEAAADACHRGRKTKRVGQACHRRREKETRGGRDYSWKRSRDLLLTKTSTQDERLASTETHCLKLNEEQDDVETQVSLDIEINDIHNTDVEDEPDAKDCIETDERYEQDTIEDVALDEAALHASIVNATFAEHTRVDFPVKWKRKKFLKGLWRKFVPKN